MHKEIVLTELKTLLETLNDQFSVFENQQDPTQFEFDLLIGNARKLAAQLEHLNRMQYPQSVPPPLSRADFPPAPSPVTFRIEPRKQPPRKKPADPGPELFPETENIFTMKLKEAREKSLGPKAKEKEPLALKSIIGIHDKFAFINELFGGNLGDYNKFIESLNNATDLTEAYDLVESARKKNLWDPSSNVFKKLGNTIELFMKNR